MHGAGNLGNVKMSAKKYLGVLAESVREGVDAETDTLTIKGDLAKEIADTLQKISEELRK